MAQPDTENPDVEPLNSWKPRPLEDRISAFKRAGKAAGNQVEGINDNESSVSLSVKNKERKKECHR